MTYQPQDPYFGKLKPKFTNRVAKFQPVPLERKLGKIGCLIGAVILLCFMPLAFGISSLVSDRGQPEWSMIILPLLAIGGTVFLTWFYTKDMQEAGCPYCGKRIDTSLAGPRDKNRQVECQHCHEWLISDQGKIRAFRHEDIGDRKEFTAPYFVKNVWPKECIVCGRKATRIQETGVIEKNLSIKAHLRGRTEHELVMARVPYCNDHYDMVRLKLYGPDPRHFFLDYDARRRFLSLNKKHRALSTADLEHI